MVFAYPHVDLLRKHFLLVEAIVQSNFHVIHCEKLTGAVTIDQFAAIFYNALFQSSDNVSFN